MRQRKAKNDMRAFYANLAPELRQNNRLRCIESFFALAVGYFAVQTFFGACGGPFYIGGRVERGAPSEDKKQQYCGARSRGGKEKFV